MFGKYKAWYRGAWGTQPRRLVTVTGIDTNKGRIVLDCTDEAGCNHWGYLNQFDAVNIDDLRK